VLALLSTAWAVREIPADSGIVERAAVALTVVGGEMYNVPTSIELVTTPLVGGPLSTALPTAVNSLGYLMSATVVFIQLHAQVLNGLLVVVGTSDATTSSAGD
jgi:hypothetical protein